MLDEPQIKRAIAFVDGQNLFYAAKEAFGYDHPNYDVLTLGRRVCEQQGWELKSVRFYSGVPDRQDNLFWNEFWEAKLRNMGRRGVHVFSRALRYRNQTVILPDGTSKTILVGEEKGIDVRIALDAIHLAERNEYDVALIFSQDQDLSEVASDVRLIGREHGRWVKIVSAYPFSPTTRNRRGINTTTWLRIDRALYDSCLDARDYREKRA